MNAEKVGAWIGSMVGSAMSARTEIALGIAPWLRYQLRSTKEFYAAAREQERERILDLRARERGIKRLAKERKNARERADRLEEEVQDLTSIALAAADLVEAVSKEEGAAGQTARCERRWLWLALAREVLGPEHAFVVELASEAAAVARGLASPVDEVLPVLASPPSTPVPNEGPTAMAFADPEPVGLDDTPF